MKIQHSAPDVDNRKLRIHNAISRLNQRCGSMDRYCAWTDIAREDSWTSALLTSWG